MTTDHAITARGSTSYLALVCLVAALGGLLFGYDTAVIAGAIGFLKDHFRLTPLLVGWAASCALLGCVLGVCVAGFFSDGLGRKKTLVLAGLLFLASAVGTARPEWFVPADDAGSYARALAWLGGLMTRWFGTPTDGTAVPAAFVIFVLFRILGGVGVGVASMASPMYIAEITPARVRGRMVSVNQFAIIAGMLVIYFVNYFIERQGDQAWNVATGWRWMFASGVIPSIVFLALLTLVPESPRWLGEHGREDRARQVLARVGGDAFADQEMATIRQAARAGRDSLFGGAILRPLLLGIALAVLQQVTGINVFLYYAPEIFKQFGSSVDAALLQTIVVGAVNLAFTVFAIWTVDLIGRKPLMIVGAAGMGLSLVAMGLSPTLGLPATWTLVFILAYIASFALSVGPVTWVILSEIFPTRIRGRALAIATFFLWVANFIVSLTFPWLDQDAWLVERFHHGAPFYLYAFFCLVLVLTVALRVPETRGRSLEEIEGLWAGPGDLDPAGGP